jgi:hypothetical protein
VNIEDGRLRVKALRALSDRTEAARDEWVGEPEHMDWDALADDLLDLAMRFRRFAREGQAPRG